MSVNAIRAGYQNQANLSSPVVEKEKKNHGDAAQVSKLNAEIKEDEAEIKETMKEIQKAAKESISGASEKAQMLQSKILMQQQEVMVKQIQLKEIQSTKDSTTENVSAAADAKPRFDRYVAEGNAQAPDNVYRLEEKDGARQIVFNRLEEQI